MRCTFVAILITYLVFPALAVEFAVLLGEERASFKYTEIDHTAQCKEYRLSVATDGVSGGGECIYLVEYATHDTVLDAGDYLVRRSVRDSVTARRLQWRYELGSGGGLQVIGLRVGSVVDGDTLTSLPAVTDSASLVQALTEYWDFFLSERVAVPEPVIQGTGFYE